MKVEKLNIRKEVTNHLYNQGEVVLHFKPSSHLKIAIEIWKGWYDFGIRWPMTEVPLLFHPALVVDTDETLMKSSI